MLTVFDGGNALFGGAAGNVVPFVLWFNLMTIANRLVPIAASRCGMEHSFASAVGYRLRTCGIQVLASSAERFMCSVNGHRVSCRVRLLTTRSSRSLDISYWAAPDPKRT